MALSGHAQHTLKCPLFTQSGHCGPHRSHGRCAEWVCVCGVQKASHLWLDDHKIEIGERERLAALGARGDETGSWAGRALRCSLRMRPSPPHASARSCPPPFPRLHPCPGRYQHFRVMAEPCFAWTAALTRGELRAPDVIAPSHPVQSASARLHA